MDNLSNAKADFAGSAAALKEPHLWLMSLLYIGTFGSFIGFASVFPKLIADQFPEFSSIAVGGAVPRLPRRARRLARPPLRRPPLRPLRRRPHHDGRLRGHGHDHPRRGARPCRSRTSGCSSGLFLLLFASAGIGNGSTYRMVPIVFAALRRAARRHRHPAQGGRRPGPDLGDRRLRRLPHPAGAEPLVPGHRRYAGAFLGFVAGYAVLLVLTWVVYVRSATCEHKIRIETK